MLFRVLLRFVKDWTLPISMLMGTIAYFVFARATFLEPTKPFVNSLITFLTPSLIFAQLLLTFCKISVRELAPSPWHGWLLLFQVFSSVFLAALLLWVPMDDAYCEVFEAAVITGKLGGSAPSLTTYPLLSNLLAAIVVPLLFPLVEPHADITFFAAFLKILGKVFPLLLFPFFLAILLRRFMPVVHRFLSGLKDLAFYLWAVSLAIVTGETVRSLVNSEAEIYVEVMIALGGLITCVVQFYLGKRIGTRYADRISAGQALGQKNTILAIWMAYTYLNPLASVAPGSYVLWQNMFNSWQLWKKGHKG